MELHLTEKQRKEVQKIMESMSCKLDFACYKSSSEKICEAEFDAYNLVCKVDTTSPEKSNPHYDCVHRKYLGQSFNYYICLCMLRIYLAKNLNR